MTELWKTIPGYAPYEVSSLGRVRRKERVLVSILDAKGYPHLSLSIKNKLYQKKVHRLVAEAFIGPRPDGLETNHKNGVKTDNRPENLEYVTLQENHRHAAVLGLFRRGSNHGMSKLTEDDVRDIRRLYSVGGHTHKSLGEKYGVHHSTVRAIILRQNWKHVKPND